MEAPVTVQWVTGAFRIYVFEIRGVQFMEKPPIRKDYFESECGCRRWYESVSDGSVEELEEVVEYCEMHDIESGSA